MIYTIFLKCDEIDELHYNLDDIRKGRTSVDAKALLCNAGRDFDSGCYFEMACAYIMEKSDGCDSSSIVMLVLPDVVVRDILLVLDAGYKHTSEYLKQVVQNIRKQVREYGTDC